VFYQLAVVVFNGKKILTPIIPRKLTIGNGPPLTFIVIGDSTAIGQGASYKEGVAYKSAVFLAKNRTVTLINLGISGATSPKVLQNQADAAAALKANIVLICVGANDVTHLSRLKTVENSVSKIIDKIKKKNPQARVLLTGSPAMGSIARFPSVVKLIARLRTKQVNKTIQGVADKKGVERLKIAEKTGPRFLQEPKLFAEDKFHPNREGYAVWLPIIFEAF
jgi:lysophospholipase L1-like esterase